MVSATVSGEPMKFCRPVTSMISSRVVNFSASALARHSLAVAAQWRAVAAEKNLSLREVVIEVTGRQTFVGSAATVAGEINHLVQADASDGFILVPHITPGGLDGFADTVVPLLQERGVFRTEYEGATLRSHLGLDPLPINEEKAVAS